MPTVIPQKVTIPMNSGPIDGELTVPERAGAFVVLAYGTGKKPVIDRMRIIANHLHQASFGTLLCNLVNTDDGETEEVTHKLRTEMATLAARLTDVVGWLRRTTGVGSRQIGLFGASTGASVALVAAADCHDSIGALALAGGRPDLAGEALTTVKTPTLFIVGGNDAPIIDLTREVADNLRAESRTEIVLGASHLFEEPGKLDTVGRLASQWFMQHLAVPAHLREAKAAEESLSL